MSTPQITEQEALQNLRFLIENDMPEARWTVGGAMRYDRSLMAVAAFFTRSLGVRGIHSVAAAVPCRWSLDWFVQRRPVGIKEYASALEAYAHKGMGVTLVFDNPFVRAEELEDAYALQLVQELSARDRVRLNAVCVASELLAERLRALVPQLPIHCHMNRLVVEQGRRTPALYNRLAEKFSRVCLHSADAAKPALVAGIAAPEKFDVIMNDSCLRTCPVRGEHLRLLAAMRREPYNVEPMRQRSELLARVGCHNVDAAALQQKATCNLSRAEAHALYAAGFRSFMVQAQQFRNEMTLLWDIFQCLFHAPPELSNKVALIATSAMAEVRRPSGSPPSGLKAFSFTNYE